jgi:hypothetical protein
MSIQIPAQGSPADPALRKALVRSVAVVAVLAAGISAVGGLEKMLNATFDKPPAPLSKPLPEMSRSLGAGERYLAAGPDQKMNAEMVESLGTTDYLVRQYRDTTLAANALGSIVNLNLNYYESGSSTPHVPEICWAGSGLIQAKGGQNNFVVKGVKRRDGSLIDLPMRLISFEPPAGQPKATPSGEPIYSNVAYVFHVNGEYVAGAQEVTSLFWKASYHYAYHCKIEITPIDPADPLGRQVLTCTQEEAKKIAGEFIREALPEVEACLPNPAILTGRDTETSVQGSKQR